MNKKLPIYIPVIEDIKNVDSIGLKSISLVEQPAIQKEFIKMNKKQEEIKFYIIKDQKIITGPILIVDYPVYRKSKNLGEYYLVFTKDVIKEISIKYSKQLKINNIDNEHDRSDIVNGIMFESQLSKTENELGYDDVPVGSQYGSFYIVDDNYQENEIKTGNVKGFSIDAVLNLINEEELNEEEILYNKIIKKFNESGFKLK